jgi:rhodanese-related sulfurtransferase
MILSRFLTWFVAIWIAAEAHAEVVKLGVVVTGTQTPVSFVYKNTGKQPVLVEELVASCGCLTATGLPAVVEPGQTLTVAGVHRAENPGKIEVAARLVGGEPRKPLTEYSLVGFVAVQDWLVPVADAAARHTKGEVLVVDTREQGRYDQAHIPQSHNERAFAIKTRLEWRNRPLILVDEGYAPEALLGDLVTLRQRGFTRVQVLAGGLAAWARHDLPLSGTRTGAVAIAQVAAADFTRAAATTGWRIFDWDNAAARSQLLEQITKDVRSPFLVVAAAEASYAEVERSVSRQNHAARLYYLKGGASQLVAFQKLQAAAALHTGQTFQTSSEHRPFSGLSSGCGSCPK